MSEVRRDRLRMLVDQHGGPGALAKRLGYANGTFIVQMAGPHPTRDVSERTARMIEMRLGLPIGWMDSPVDSGAASVSSAPQPPPPPALETDRTAEIVSAVIKSVREQFPDRTLPPETIGHLVEMALEHAATVGHVDLDYIHKTVRLVASVR